MICIKRVFKTAEKAAEVKQAYMNALKIHDLPVDSKVSIADGNYPNEFLVILGDPNGNDMMETWIEPGAVVGNSFPSQVEVHSNNFSK